MNKRLFVLAHEIARRRAVEAVAGAPQGWRVTIEEPRRSLDQNDRLHAGLQELGELLGWRWAGFNVDLDDLKSILVAAYRKTQKEHARVLPGFDGEPVLMSWRTRDMGRAEMSELIEMLNETVATMEAASERQAID